MYYRVFTPLCDNFMCPLFVTLRYQVIQSKNHIHNLLETVQQQQKQFLNMGRLCNTSDPCIPVAFTKDNRVHIGPKMEMRVVALGLDGAGKTSILFKLKQDEFVATITTIGKS